MKLLLLVLIYLMPAVSMAEEKSVLRYSYYDGKPVIDHQSYDLYLTENSSTEAPLFAFVHGGYWVEDDRRYGFGRNIAKVLTDRGFAVALIRYRLAPNHKHPTQINDITRAFNRLLKQQDNKYYNSNCIIAAGHSAGGHLVSLMALNPVYLKAYQLDANQLAAVVSFSGVYDLNDASGEVSDRIKKLYKKVFSSQPEQLKSASPLTHVRADAPPFLILSGSDDFPGFDFDAKAFHQALQKQGHVAVNYQQMPERNHFQMVDFNMRNFELSRLIENFANCH